MVLNSLLCFVVWVVVDRGMARVVSVGVPKDVSEKMLCIGLLKVFRVGLRRESFSGIEEEYRRKGLL